MKTLEELQEIAKSHVKHKENDSDYNDYYRAALCGALTPSYEFALEEIARLKKIIDELENCENLSECCTAPIHEDTDICSNCKEHC